MQVRINLLWGAILLCLLVVTSVGVVSAENSPRTEALRSATADAAAATRALQIYFIDVEGGQATLFVTPEKHSLLIDTGFAGNNGRDSDRIVAAARKAGIDKIDYVLITHFHGDHVGGAPELAAKIPVGTFIDHGENSESNTTGFQIPPAYQDLVSSGKYKHVIAKPGDTIPVAGINVTVVSANTSTIANALPGAGETNSACKDSVAYEADKTENHNSVGVAITFGKLRILDLGDLTDDVEMKLMCPQNKLGKFDVYVVSHHGSPDSGSRELLNAIAPRVAIMDNGAKKGGDPHAYDIIEHSPRIESLWQLHYADDSGSDHNAAPEFIANLDGPDAGNYIELIGREDGAFAMFNSRTGKRKDSTKVK
jgi:competence protein ComEC